MATTPYYDPTAIIQAADAQSAADRANAAIANADSGITATAAIGAGYVGTYLPPSINSFFADTLGVVFRASTGAVDPWTKNEIVQNETAGLIQAGMDSTTAYNQAYGDVTNVLTSFTLGGGDPVGADPSQASLSLPSWQSLKDAIASATKDNGTGCGITNISACFPTIPTWLWWVLGALVVLGGLLILRPYVEFIDELFK